MEIIPFEKVIDLPTGYVFDGHSQVCDIDKSEDFIEVAAKVKIEVLRATNKSYFRGVSAYMFDACAKIGFDANYNIIDVEFRHPFSALPTSGLFYKGKNLFSDSLGETRKSLASLDVPIEIIDVGLFAPSLGITFFSDDYHGDLNARLDAVTVHFAKK